MYDFSLDQRPKVRITDIIIKPGRGRKDFSGVLKLKESIEKVGYIHPVVLTQKDAPEGKYYLVAGETRVRCGLLIPETKGLIPFTLREELAPVEQKRIELYENIHRNELSPLEQIELHAQIDEFERSQVGDRTSKNPDGWNLQKTAELVGANVGDVSRQIKHAKLLRERPDIKKRIENLPLEPGIRVASQILEAERVDRLHKSGGLTLTSELHHKDALSFLKLQPDASIDLILTDPPFGMEELESRRDKEASTNQSYTAQLKQHDNSTISEVLTLLTSIAPEIYRTLKPGAHFYIFFEPQYLGELSTILTASKLEILWPLLIWDKGRSTSPFRGYSYLPCYEAIIFGCRPTGKPNESPRRLISSSNAILRFPPLHASKKLHPFEKPGDLLADLIKRSTNFGDVVCDPFAGSASTLLAAKQCGRKTIGCELDHENFLKAQGRLLLEEGPK